tara:strand:- start:144 stop:1079 length:936 start_codon:yes stop_codon:yes gene_type:complete
MKLKKPNFWDYKKPNVFAYLLLPFSYLVILFNFFKNKKGKKIEKIKTICIGNIYIGGTGKTPLSIKINNILNNLNFKTAFVKKKYHDQEDEQKLLSSKGKLFCENNRIEALEKAINENMDIAIFDDGLQDKQISYHISFVCFNSLNWIGNGLVLPSGPLRENLKNLKKYDGVFLNGNGEDITEIKSIIKNINPILKIFESEYLPINAEKFDKNQNYLAFSGIGNPKSFINTLKKNNFKIVKNLDFPDHYNYSNQDLTKIKETAKKINSKIITTEKDYKRLNKLNSEDIEYLEIELKITNEKELINFLKQQL